ncbi:response regulator transcription factor [Prosthecobacter sp.]|uniref:response regulator transcription factor n=1 Tax=Prosthecobacter sp. TaxID=1965333 RepID=UPI002AB9D400|nr:response regulator transcription factor [Prosthecobacter sp.]MDZ4402727.1 response regulator transcription factor [Prosthecobacter sp.]
MRILVVEDEPDLLRILARTLREEGYAVDEAADGEDGLFKAEGVAYDAIILDVMLPVMDGFEMLRRLRLVKHTPVLMLTARIRTADRVRGLDSGADDYLPKPYDIDELLARLRALIRRTGSAVSTTMSIADVCIDFAARRVTRTGAEVALTSREYSLLEYLAQHRGRLLTRTELYEHLYDENSDTLSNLLDVVVSNVRKKLGHEFITTRRGHGYSIE